MFSHQVKSANEQLNFRLPKAICGSARALINLANGATPSASIETECAKRAIRKENMQNERVIYSPRSDFAHVVYWAQIGSINHPESRALSHTRGPLSSNSLIHKEVYFSTNKTENLSKRFLCEKSDAHRAINRHLLTYWLSPKGEYKI